MLKAALTFLAIAAGSAFAVKTGETVYSRFQMQLFPGAGLKVMQDPANVWSWHKQYPGANASESVLVDFDQNGRMDTEDPDVRVILTDVMVTQTNPVTSTAGLSLTLAGSQGLRLDLRMAEGREQTLQAHLVTPLVLPVRSDLVLTITPGNQSPGPNASVTLIGRVVTL